MAQEPKKKSGDKKKAQVVVKDDKHKSDSPEAPKLQIYLKTIPAIKKKFTKLSKKKTALTSAELLLVDPRYSASKEGPFGLGPLVFSGLQRFNNIDCFMAVYVAAVLIYGILFAFADMILSLYKNYFSLSKMEAYLMDFSDVIASFIVAVFIGHFGSKGSRVKWVAAAYILMGLGSIVFAFPFFNYQIIRPGRQGIELCTEENTKDIGCLNSLPDRSKCIYLHIIGQCLYGISGMPILILGITFIVDHIPTRSAGLYLAVGHSAHLMGYLLGVIAGIKNFTTPSQEKINEAEPDKLYQLLQRGWWKSFLFVAVISFCLSLITICFPTSFPGAHKLRLAKRKEPPTIDRKLKDKDIPPHLKGFLLAIGYMFKNPLWLTQTMSKISENLTFDASLYFLPHHLQSQFLITPDSSNLLTGLFVIPGGIIGHFLGGLIVDRLEMTNKNKLKFTLVTTVVSVVLYLLIFFVECKTSKFAGINEDYDGFGILGNLTAECNKHCACTTVRYSSICGRDEKEYFSPCFAGCRATKTNINEKAYYNCSCIREGLTTSDSDGQFIDAVGGTCNTNCLTLPLFFAFYFSATVFSKMCSIPIILNIIQSVPANFNSFALGVTYGFLRFVVSIPGPFLFSMSAATACVYWEITECGSVGRCWIYNKEKLVFIFIGMWVSSQLFIALWNVYAIHIYDYVVKGEIPASKATPVKGQKKNFSK